MSALVQHDRPSSDKLAGIEVDEELEEDSHTCGKCQQVFTTIESYLQHKLKEHKYRVRYTKSSTRKRLLVPRFVEAPAKVKREKPDSVETEPKEKFKRVKQVHTTDDIIQSVTGYQCETCKKLFKREAALKRHKEYDHQKNVYGSDLEDDDFPETLDDDEDDYDATGDAKAEEEDAVLEKEMEETAPKDDDNTQTQVVHIEVIPTKTPVTSSTEEKDRPFECVVCGNRFKEQSTLKAHLLTHTNKRSFPCTWENCLYAFKTKGSLKRHMRRHTGERPYVCSLCNRRFGESGALTRHLKARVPCNQKTDQELPRYGKRQNFVDFSDKNGQPTSVLISTSQQLESASAQERQFLQTITQGGATVYVEALNGEAIDVNDPQTQELLQSAALAADGGQNVIIQIPNTKCMVCSAEFGDSESLKSHLKMHLEGLAHRCDLCMFASDKQQELILHMDDAHNATLALENTKETQDIPLVMDMDENQVTVAQLQTDISSLAENNETVTMVTEGQSENVEQTMEQVVIDSCQAITIVNSSGEIETQREGVLNEGILGQEIVETEAAVTMDIEGKELHIQEGNEENHGQAEGNQALEQFIVHPMGEDGESVQIGKSIQLPEGVEIIEVMNENDLHMLEGSVQIVESVDADGNIIHQSMSVQDAISSEQVQAIYSQADNEQTLVEPDTIQAVHPATEETAEISHQSEPQEVTEAVEYLNNESSDSKYVESAYNKETIIISPGDEIVQDVESANITSIEALNEQSETEEKSSDAILESSEYEKQDGEAGSQTQQTDRKRDAAIALQQLLELQNQPGPREQPAGGNRKSHKCHICQRTFRGASYLKLHIRSHTGERPYKCSMCPKTFTSKDTLNKHQQTHSDVRQYKCGECGKMFKRISHIREHLKVHTEDRPYSCTLCEKSFKTSNACKVHLRTHTDVMPWKCQMCMRMFREKSSLERHIRTHTGEKPFKCKHCGRQFGEHGTLNRHLKAKVPCTNELKQLREANAELEDASSLLAEFSSVVTDTQEYMLAEQQQLQSTQDTTEYVMVSAEEAADIQNIEIMTDSNQLQHIEGLESGLENTEYVILDDGSTVTMMDPETGQSVQMIASDAGGGAMTLVKSVDSAEEQHQTITLVNEHGQQIDAVTWASDTVNEDNSETLVIPEEAGSEEVHIASPATQTVVIHEEEGSEEVV